MPIEGNLSYNEQKSEQSFYDQVYLQGQTYSKCYTKEISKLMRAALLVLSLQPFTKHLGVDRVWGVMLIRGSEPYVTALNREATSNRFLVIDLDELLTTSWTFDDTVLEEIHPRITMLMSLAFFASVCVLLKNI